ncbi:hypothetical protein EON80_05475 [bacterium]|nr:MAG: hypothetical protein EON80_05475 [bacterium]
MKRRIIPFLTFGFLTCAILAALMRVCGSEHRPSGPELFTLRRGSFYEVLFSTVNTPEPVQLSGYRIAGRKHYGYPCYAVIVDTSLVGNTYGKLDLLRLTGNTLVAAIASLFLMGVGRLLFGLFSWLRSLAQSSAQTSVQGEEEAVSAPSVPKPSIRW